MNDTSTQRLSAMSQRMASRTGSAHDRKDTPTALVAAFTRSRHKPERISNRSSKYPFHETLLKGIQSLFSFSSAKRSVRAQQLVLFLTYSNEESTAEDWRRVGDDIYSAMRQYWSQHRDALGDELQPDKLVDNNLGQLTLFDSDSPESAEHD